MKMTGLTTIPNEGVGYEIVVLKTVETPAY